MRAEWVWECGSFETLTGPISIIYLLVMLKDVVMLSIIVKLHSSEFQIFCHNVR